MQTTTILQVLPLPAQCVVGFADLLVACRTCWKKLDPCSYRFLVLAISGAMISTNWAGVAHAQQAAAAKASATNHAGFRESSAITGPVVKAVNLGNWLLLEPWLLDINDDDLPDQSSIFVALNERFGLARAKQLLDTYRENWITLSDLQAAHSLGFNAVRLPFDCGLLEDVDRPQVLRDDAFRWLDHAVELCRQAELSVILDLHGAPGGQSLDGPSGDATSNRLWTDSDARDRTVWLWQKIAKHYANHDTVIAYDVVNEPYGDFSQDLRASMLDLFSRLYDSIREVDTQKLIYAPATLDGFAFYGNPIDKGWERVGFTQHAYPGLFDGRPAAVQSHEMFLRHWVEPVDRTVDDLKVPFLLGEYNVVFKEAGGAALTAWYAQEYERRGWSTAIWTLKRLLRSPSPDIDSWSLLSNASGLSIDFRADTYEKLMKAFQAIGTIQWRANTEFSQAKLSETVKGESSRWQWLGHDPWQSMEIETDVAGSSIIRDANWVLKGAGRDIFGKRDRFHFKSRRVQGDFEATCRVLWIDETSPWAKAGWMIRADDSADAAHLLLHASPDGKIILCGRDAKGETSWQKTVGVGGLPVCLGIKRSGDEILFSWTEVSGRSKSQVFSPPFLCDNDDALFGMAVCSLVPGVCTTVGLDRVAFKSLLSADSTAKSRTSQTDNLTFVSTPQSDSTASNDAGSESSHWSTVPLQNPSFETKGESDDRAAGWNRWGDWINRETSWKPVRDGSAIIGYHHYRTSGSDNSGIWQDVSVPKGAKVKFSVHANVDIGKPGAQPPRHVEIKLESPAPDGKTMTLAKKTFEAVDLATEDEWSLLNIEATSLGNQVRCLIIVEPQGEDGQRDGAMKFDQANLKVSMP